ncbi:MAG: winged helix-turn-helix domain-containing protein [Acidobacteriaceae bacterium]
MKLQSQPFKVLSCMLERPGEIVSREELQQCLWGDQTTVDFDHSLGTAINKLREALGDAADNPRFIETLARKGYRFIAPVAASIAAAPESLPAPPTAVPVLQEKAQHGRFWLPWVLAAFCAVLAFGLGAWIRLGNTGLHKPLRISQITFSGRVFSGEPLQENLAATATDGTRIYFQQFENGQAVLAQALIADGETSILAVPSEIAAPSLGNISPDGSQLLVRNALIPKAEQPLWILPTMGGMARNFSNTLAHDATWMPDGKHILYASGTNLYIANRDGTGSVLFAALPGRAFWLRWSPDGRLLRFTLIDALNHSTSLWEISSTGKDLRPMLSDWSHPASECCGSWTSDGKSFVFQSAHNGLNNIWVLQEKSFLDVLLPIAPIQITNGPLSYLAPTTANTGQRIFFVGLDTRSVLLKYDPLTQQFVPYGKALNAASLVDFSRDGGSVAWIDPEDSSLWCSRVDGSQRLQLTAPPMEVFMMHWSPNGKRIVLMGREPGKVWRLYIVDGQGGDLLPVLTETRNEADPDWSPNGNSLVFGRLPDLMAEKSLPKAIYMVDLKTRQVATLPNSEGLFSPRWSPDGRYIVAMPLDQSKLVLYDAAAHTWKTLIARPAHDPVWSNDSRWIYFHDFLAEDKPVYRVSVPDGKLERVAGLQSVQPLDVLDFRFAGLTPGNVPLVSARISTANMYSVNLNHR